MDRTVAAEAAEAAEARGDGPGRKPAKRARMEAGSKTTVRYSSKLHDPLILGFRDGRALTKDELKQLAPTMGVTYGQISSAHYRLVTRGKLQPSAAAEG